MLPPPEQDFSIYVGFPFCKKACAYCHYKPNIHFGVSEIPGNYLDTLLKQIRCFLQVVACEIAKTGQADLEKC